MTSRTVVFRMEEDGGGGGCEVAVAGLRGLLEWVLAL